MEDGVRIDVRVRDPLSRPFQRRSGAKAPVFRDFGIKHPAQHVVCVRMFEGSQFQISEGRVHTSERVFSATSKQLLPNGMVPPRARWCNSAAQTRSVKL